MIKKIKMIRNKIEKYVFCTSNSLIKGEYIILLIFFLAKITLTILHIGLSYVLAKQNPEKEKLSAYECGFEHYEDARHNFDVQFCTVAILFLIFDIEIIFIMPWCISIGNLDSLGFWSMIDFILELSVGYFYIWYSRALDWN